MKKEFNEEFKKSTNDLNNYSFLKGKTVSIIGASGLIGRYFLGYLCFLNEEYNLNLKINAYCRNVESVISFLRKMELSTNSATVKKYDVSEQFENDGAHYILLGASPADPISYSKYPVETFLTNILSVKNLLSQINSSTRIVYLSSGEVYGSSDAIPKAGFHEVDYGYIDHLTPRACYSMGKKAAETLALLYSQEFNSNIVIARLSHVYGPSITKTNTRADAQFLRNACFDEKIVLKSSGEQVRSYCYVSDTCNALLTLFASGEKGEAYNVTNKESIASIREYASILAKLSSKELLVQVPNETEAKGFSKVQRAVLNSSKLEKLGWEPKVSLCDGLRRTYEMYLYF